jgi:hypothetical protein
LAALFFVLALALVGADYAGLRSAHHAGVTGTVFFLIALALVLMKQVRMRRHSE